MKPEDKGHLRLGGLNYIITAVVTFKKYTDSISIPPIPTEDHFTNHCAHYYGYRGCYTLVRHCLGFYVIQKTEGLYIESQMKRGFYESPEVS